MGTKKEKEEVAPKPVVETKPKTAPKRVAAKPVAKAPAKPANNPVATVVAKPLAKPVATTVKKASTKAASVAKPEHEHIEVRAYHIALERNASGHKADPVADWLEAERQIRR